MFRQIKNLLAGGGSGSAGSLPANYTEARIAEAWDSALGFAHAVTVAAVEAAAGLLERCVRGAVVTGLPGVRGSDLAWAARRMCTHGEAVALHFPRMGGTRIVPASAVDIYGTSEDNWEYDLDVSAPDAQHRYRVPARRVLHFRWSYSPRATWRGLSPLANSSLTTAALALAEAQVKEEMRMPNKKIVPIPDMSEKQRGELSKSMEEYIRDPRRQIIFPPGAYTAAHDPDHRGSPKTADWGNRPIQAAAQATTLEARRDLENSVYAACGIPAVIFNPGAAAGNQRAAEKRLRTTCLMPLAEILTTELRQKIPGSDPRISFRRLSLLDGQIAGRAVPNLMAAGFSAEESLEIIGID